jgi:TonB family protein
MREAPGSVPPAQVEPPARDIRLLVAPEPRFYVFLKNFRDLFGAPEAPVRLESAPGTFWSDVFVHRPLPWPRFVQSGVCHVLAVAAVWAGSRFLALQPHATLQPAFTHADVVSYTPSEYLPPLDTRGPTFARVQKADPEYSAQPIISVPPEADNRSQTIVMPPHIELRQDVASPNIVALLEKMPTDRRMPIAPSPVMPVSQISRISPQMERSVIAPPPDVHASSRQTMQAPQAAVVAPPPALEAGSTRRLGDLNIGHSAVIAPAPQLSLDEQRAFPRRAAALTQRSANVVAPPPSLASAGRARSGGGMIALSLHPAVGAPPDPPAGNRRGTFAATPGGHRGASGAVGSSTGDSKSSGSASGRNSSDLPSGLYVGKTATPTSQVAGDPSAKNSGTDSVNPNLIASAHAPRVSTHTALQSETATKLSQEERGVFGSRKFYSLSLNMPNLNSAGGSWIVRFAALKDANFGGPPSHASSSADPTSLGTQDNPAADLNAPSATHKVDPAYPLELMRQNVGGTVILYGIIHADGTVGSVRVLRSVDERLDRFASEAIAKWQFQPATKNGAPVDVEATFLIPFHPTRAGSNF